MWLLDHIYGYSMRGAYHFLTSAYEPTDRDLVVNVWHKHIPLKVSLFGWRLLRNRLSIKDNLIWCRVITVENNLCAAGCGFSETANHIFLGCVTFGRVWPLVWQWLQLSLVIPCVLRDHFFQFSHMVAMPRSSHSFFKIIWLASAWVIWKERNNWIFQQ